MPSGTVAIHKQISHEFKGIDNNNISNLNNVGGALRSIDNLETKSLCEISEAKVQQLPRKISYFTSDKPAAIPNNENILNLNIRGQQVQADST